ncbi:MAG: InlB B-repeat-containing protein [Lachnospiraceae bacterium]|nr:InlB B-repeat-containing protein [Lachnospiraceae bacterium]
MKTARLSLLRNLLCAVLALAFVGVCAILGRSAKAYESDLTDSLLFAEENRQVGGAVILRANGTYYTIEYDANGGSGAPSKQSIRYGNPATISTKQPTRTNYTFKGWATSSGGSVAYAPGAKYTAQKSIKLYAVWERTKYKISYKGNGGTAATGQYVPPTSQTFYAGNSVTIGDCGYTRSGYTFSGWSTSSGDNNSVKYKRGDKVTFSGNVTLYAVWKPTEYLVVFDANGGSGAPGNQTKVHGKNLTLSSTKPSRTGYTFKGWATSASGSVSYSAGGTYSNNASIRLYAVWSINTYSVSYNANGGSGAPGSQTKTYGVNLTLSTTKPTRTGYTFQGWATSASGSVAYAAGATYTSNSAVTLYAVWKINTYSVTYNANGGSGAPGAQTKTYGTNLTLSATKPARTGYSFQGWATSASGAVAYSAGGTYTGNSAITLYAVWKADTYSVTFNANGGSGAPGAQTKTYGVNLTLSSTKPTRTGHTFQGWATSASGAVVYAAGATYTGNGALNLYAVWKANTYTIKYNLNCNDSSCSGKPGDQTYTYAQGQSINLSSTIPTRATYEFLGWSLDPSATTATYAAGSAWGRHSTPSSGTTYTLYAVWKRIRYTITYDGNGGTGATGPNVPSASQDFYAGNAVTINASCYTKKGCTFIGWSTSKTATTATYTAGQTGVKFSGNTTLYAVWKTTEYTIVYDANGGTNPPANQTKLHGTDLTLTTSKPSRTGYSFQGWATSSSGAVVYASGATYSSNQTIRLYAVWKVDTYDVIYDVNGGLEQIANQTKEYGVDLTLSSTIPTRTGYAFQGWSTSSNGSVIYNAGDTYSYNSKLILYAVWKEIYTISYYENDYTATKIVETKYKDEKVVITCCDFERDDYLFLGWARNPNDSEPKYKPGDIVDAFNKDTSLFAIWTPRYYGVSFIVEYYTSGESSPHYVNQEFWISSKATLEDNRIELGNDYYPTFPTVYLSAYEATWYERKGESTNPSVLAFPLGLDGITFSTLWTRGSEFINNSNMLGNNIRGCQGVRLYGWIEKELYYSGSGFVLSDIYKPNDGIDFSERIKSPKDEIELLALWVPSEMSDEEVKKRFEHWTDGFSETASIGREFVTVTDSDADRRYGANQHDAYYQNNTDMIKKYVKWLSSSSANRDYLDELENDPKLIGVSVATLVLETIAGPIDTALLGGVEAAVFFERALDLADEIPAKDCIQFPKDNLSNDVSAYFRNTCGAFAMINTYLYLSGEQNVEKSRVKKILEEFLDEQNSFLDWIVRINAHGDLPYYNLTDYLNNHLGEKGYICEWINSERYGMNFMLSDTREMLEKGIPVIAAYVGPEIKPYVMKDGRLIRDNNNHEYGNHYFVITGIYEDSYGETVYLKVSSCGREEYILYDEYISNASFESIDLGESIQQGGVGKVVKFLLSHMDGYATSYMSIRKK